MGRGATYIDNKRKEKVAYFCNMEKEEFISNLIANQFMKFPLIFKDSISAKKYWKTETGQ